MMLDCKARVYPEGRVPESAYDALYK